MRHAFESIFFSAALGAGFALGQAADLPTPSASELPHDIAWVPLAPVEDEANPAKLLGAARGAYKVLVDETGFELHPLLGPDAPRSLPLAWHTRSIHVGSATLPLQTAPERVHGAWELALHHPGFSEHYELGDAGLEMSWVFHALPLDAGDLVIRGAVRSELRADRQGARHGSLVFVDASGTPVLSFGAAIAFDGAGRSCEVSTSYDGETIALTVDAAWLRGATLPLTVDPLVGPIEANVGGIGGGFSSIDVARYPSLSDRPLMVGFSRAYSVADHDIYAVLLHENFTSPVTVHSDVASATSDKEVSVAFAGGASRWVIAYQRDFSNAFGAFSGVRVHFRDAADLDPSHGTTWTMTNYPQQSFSRPRLGGVSATSLGTHVMLVHEADVTTTRANTPNTEILGRLLDAQGATIGNPFLPGGSAVGTSLDRELGEPNTNAWDSLDGWMIVWQELDRVVASDDWDLRGALTDSGGSVLSRGLLENGGMTRHLTQPRVAGGAGEYLLSYGVSGNLQDTAPVEIRTRRFQWSYAQSQPVFLAPARIVASGASAFFPYANGSLDRCANTHAHWLLSYGNYRFGANLTTRLAVFAARLGGTGAVVEQATLVDDSTYDAILPATCYTGAGPGGVFLTGNADVLGTVRAFRLDFDPSAGTSIVGVGCGPAGMTSGYSHAGNTDFRVFMGGAPPSAAAVLLLSLTSTHLPLDGIGMSGCVLGVDPATLLVSLSAIASPGGNAGMTLPLPDEPVFRGDFVVQWAYLNPGTNALGVQLTDGRLIRVR